MDLEHRKRIVDWEYFPHQVVLNEVLNNQIMLVTHGLIKGQSERLNGQKRFFDFTTYTDSKRLFDSIGVDR